VKDQAYADFSWMLELIEAAIREGHLKAISAEFHFVMASRVINGILMLIEAGWGGNVAGGDRRERPGDALEEIRGAIIGGERSARINAGNRPAGGLEHRIDPLLPDLALALFAHDNDLKIFQSRLHEFFKS